MTDAQPTADAGTPARLRSRLIASIVVLNAFVFMLTAYSLVRDRRQYEERVTVSTQNLATLVEHDIAADFHHVRLLLDTSAQELERQLAAGRLDGARVNAFLAQQAAHVLNILGLRLIDADGMLRHGSGLGSDVSLDMSAQEHFVRHRDNPDAGLVIASPIRSLSGKGWVIPISRRLRGPGGKFAGVLYASFPVEEFADLFTHLNVGPHGLVTLRNFNYVVLARYPEREEGRGSIGVASVSAETRAALAGGEQQKTYRTVSTVDKMERVLTLRRVTGHPLYVLVGLAPDDYLGAWWKNVYETLALTAFFTFTSILLGLLLLRAWQRQWESGQKLRETESLWSFALESGSYCVWDWNLTTGKVHLSKLGKGLFGFAEDEIGDDAREWEQRVHPQDQPRVREMLRSVLRAQVPNGAIEYRMRTKDEQWKWILTRGTVAGRGADGRVQRMIGTHIDISERREREEATRLAATVFDMADEGVMVTDADNRIVAVNPAFSAITGYAAAQVLGADPHMLAAGVHDQAFYRELWTSLAEHGSWRGEIINRKKGGEVYVEWLSIKAVFDAEGRRTHYVGVFSDITTRKETEKRLHHLALHDALTDLPNRLLLAERLEQAIARAKRERTRLGLLYFDLDRFKPVNDDYGHAMGDGLLREVARRAQENVRASDTLARLGGDEFVALLAPVNEARDALAVAEKIRLDMERPFEIGGHLFRVSASIGVALYPEHGADSETLLRHADDAMYQAKHGGRDRVCLYRADASSGAPA